MNEAEVAGRPEAGVTIKQAVDTAGPALLYGLRLTAAVAIALFLAFWLQLDNPSWAGTSAAIVCQPVLGASLRKGIFRLIGTTVGASATVLLTAAFPQDRLGFLVGLAVWCAACSFVSTILRDFAAYAAMLAGYTMAIIAASSIAAPDQVFFLALYRATEISLGIVCGMAVMSFTDLGHAQRGLALELARLVTDIGAGLKSQIEAVGGTGERFRTHRRGLVKQVAALDPLLDQAIGESAVVSDGRRTLQAGIQGLFLALAAWRTLELHLRRPDHAEAEAQTKNLAAALPASLGQPFRQDDTSDAIDPVQAQARFQDWSSNSHALSARSADRPSLRLGIDRLAVALDGLSRAVNAIVLLADGEAAQPLDAVPKTFIPDLLPPLVNAGRVFIALSAAILFYIATSWDAGPTFITFVAVTVLLLSPRDEAAYAAAVGFGAGTVLTAILAAFVKFALLPNHESYGSFVLIMGCVLVPLAALSSIPRFAPVFTAASMNFVPLLAPTNQITFDTVGFYNNAIAIVGGSITGTVILRIIAPVPTAIRTRRLLGLTIRDLRGLARRPGRWTPDQWRSRIFARLSALPSDATAEDGSRLLSALTVGVLLLRLNGAKTTKGGATRIDAVLASVSQGRVGEARERLKAMRDDVAHEPGASSQGALRLQAAAREIADILKDNPAYFGAALA